MRGGCGEDGYPAEDPGAVDEVAVGPEASAEEDWGLVEAEGLSGFGPACC